MHSGFAKEHCSTFICPGQKSFTFDSCCRLFRLVWVFLHTGKAHCQGMLLCCITIVGAWPFNFPKLVHWSLPWGMIHSIKACTAQAQRIQKLPCKQCCGTAGRGALQLWRYSRLQQTPAASSTRHMCCLGVRLCTMGVAVTRP